MKKHVKIPPVWAKMVFLKLVSFLGFKVYGIQCLDKENRKISNKTQCCKVKNSLQITKNNFNYNLHN